MSFYITGISDTEERLRKRNLEKQFAESEWVDFYTDLNEFEKQALKNIIVQEGKKLEIENKKQELEKLKKDVLDLGGNYERRV